MCHVGAAIHVTVSSAVNSELLPNEDVYLQHSSYSGRAGNFKHCFLCFRRLCTILQVFFSSVLLHSLSSGKGARLLFGLRGKMHSVAKLLTSLHLNMSTSGYSDERVGNASFTNIVGCVCHCVN